jgi:purine-binding chemotaxis protein CheW
MTSENEMPQDGETMTERVLEMRRAFDGAFALPRAARATDVEQAVIVQAGAQLLACRIHEVTRFESDRKVIPLAGLPGLVGVAGIRGKLVPVYDLATVIGAPAAGATRWLALCGEGETIGLAFSRIDRFVRVPREDVYAIDEAAATSHVRQLLRAGTTAYHVLDVGSVLSAIRARSAGEAARG